MLRSMVDPWRTADLFGLRRTYHEWQLNWKTANFIKRWFFCEFFFDFLSQNMHHNLHKVWTSTYRFKALLLGFLKLAERRKTVMVERRCEVVSKHKWKIMGKAIIFQVRDSRGVTHSYNDNGIGQHPLIRRVRGQTHRLLPRAWKLERFSSPG